MSYQNSRNGSMSGQQSYMTGPPTSVPHPTSANGSQYSPEFRGHQYPRSYQNQDYSSDETAQNVAVSQAGHGQPLTLNQLLLQNNSPSPQPPRLSGAVSPMGQTAGYRYDPYGYMPKSGQPHPDGDHAALKDTSSLEQDVMRTSRSGTPHEGVGLPPDQSDSGPKQHPQQNRPSGGPSAMSGYAAGHPQQPDSRMTQGMLRPGSPMSPMGGPGYYSPRPGYPPGYPLDPYTGYHPQRYSQPRYPTPGGYAMMPPPPPPNTGGYQDYPKLSSYGLPPEHPGYGTRPPYPDMYAGRGGYPQSLMNGVASPRGPPSRYPPPQMPQESAGMTPMQAEQTPFSPSQQHHPPPTRVDSRDGSVSSRISASGEQGQQQPPPTDISGRPPSRPPSLALSPYPPAPPSHPTPSSGLHQQRAAPCNLEHQQQPVPSPKMEMSEDLRQLAASNAQGLAPPPTSHVPSAASPHQQQHHQYMMQQPPHPVYRQSPPMGPSGMRMPLRGPPQPPNGGMGGYASSAGGNYLPGSAGYFQQQAPPPPQYQYGEIPPPGGYQHPSSPPSSAPYGQFAPNPPPAYQRGGYHPPQHQQQMHTMLLPPNNLNPQSASCFSRLMEMGYEPERRRWLEHYFYFMEEIGKPLTGLPQVVKQPLDLYRFYLAVRERGGVMEIIKTKRWKEISQLVNVNASASAAYTLRKNYCKYLLDYECRFDHGSGGGADVRAIAAQIESLSGKKKKPSVGSLGGGSSELNESSTSSSTPFPPPSPVGSQSSASSNLVMPGNGSGATASTDEGKPIVSPVNTAMSGVGGAGGVVSPALSSSAANSPYTSAPPPQTSTPPTTTPVVDQAPQNQYPPNWRPSPQSQSARPGPDVAYPSAQRVPGPIYGEMPRQPPFHAPIPHPASYGRGPLSSSVANHPMAAMEGMRPGSPVGPHHECSTPTPPAALPHGTPVSRAPTGNTVHHPPTMYPPQPHSGAGGGGYIQQQQQPPPPAPPPPSFTAHYQPPLQTPTRPHLPQPAPPPPPQYQQRPYGPSGYPQRPPNGVVGGMPPHQRHPGMIMGAGGPPQQVIPPPSVHPGMMPFQMQQHQHHPQLPPQHHLQNHHPHQPQLQQPPRQITSGVAGGPPGYAAAYWRRVEAVQHFPPGCVEATPIDASRRKRFRIKDLGQLTGSKLMMALRCGLPSETTWALNALNIILREDPGVIESLLANSSSSSSIAHQPANSNTAVSMTALITALTNHLRHSANELFPQHHISADLELPALLSSSSQNQLNCNHHISALSSYPPFLDAQTLQKSTPGAHLFIDLLAEVASKRGGDTESLPPNGLIGLEREIALLSNAKGVSVSALRDATRQLLRGVGKNGWVAVQSKLPTKTVSVDSGLDKSMNSSIPTYSVSATSAKRGRGRLSTTTLGSDHLSAAATVTTAAPSMPTNAALLQPTARPTTAIVVNNLGGPEAYSNVRRLALFALDELLETKEAPPPVLLPADLASEVGTSPPASPHPPGSMHELFIRGGADSTCFILPHPGSYSGGRASKRVAPSAVESVAAAANDAGSTAASAPQSALQPSSSSSRGSKRARSSSSSSSLPVLSPQKVDEEEKENECGVAEENGGGGGEAGDEDSELNSHRLMADSRGYCPLRARSEIIRVGDLALWPVDVPSEEAEGYALRCLAVSTVLRNLSFMPSAERALSLNRAVLALATRLITIGHYHADETEHVAEDWASVEDDLSRLYSKSAWWMPWREELCENILVLLVNISGHLNCMSLHESIARPLLEGLLHWATCLTAAATDPLPGHRLISPSRLALECLNRLSVNGSNVAMLLATAQNGSTDKKLFDRLVSWLALPEDQVTRELALSTVYYLTEPPGNIFQPPNNHDCSPSDSCSKSNSTASFGLSMLAQAKPCPVAGLVSFIEIAESKTRRVLDQYGLQALQEQPELMGTSLELVRRAGALLERLAANPLARNRFSPDLEIRLLSLSTSRVLDATVAQLLAGCLFNLPQQVTSSIIGLIPELPSFNRVVTILAPCKKQMAESKVGDVAEDGEVMELDEKRKSQCEGLEPEEEEKKKKPEKEEDNPRSPQQDNASPELVSAAV